MPMSSAQAYAIEVHGRSAGIVVAGQSGFTFFAAERLFSDLDGRVYRRVHQAEQAAVRLLAARTAAARHR